MATTKKVTALPERVSINLDSLEREDRPEEFSAVVGGKRLVFADPKEVDYRLLMEFEANPNLFFSEALSEEDKEHWDSQERIPAWKLEALVAAYRDHFGLGAPGNDAGSGT